MSNKTAYETPKLDDAQWLTNLTAIAKAVKLPHTIVAQRFGTDSVVLMDATGVLTKDGAAVAGDGGSLFLAMTLRFETQGGQNQGALFVQLIRQEERPADKVNLVLTDPGAQVAALKTSALTLYPQVLQAFPRFSALLLPGKAFETNLAEFYSHRESQLQRLEGVSSRLLEQVEKRQLTLLAEYDARRRTLEAEYEKRRTASLQQADEQHARAEAEYRQKHRELETQTADLKAKLSREAADLQAKLTREATELQTKYQLRHDALEDLHAQRQQIIDQQGIQKRQELEEEHKANVARLNTAMEEERAALEVRFQARLTVLDEDYKKRNEALQTREVALQEREKSLDDSDSRHARRQLRQDLLKTLETRSKGFKLTADTTEKRKPVLWLFIVLEAAAIILVALAGYRLYTLPVGTTDILEILRLPLSFLAFIGLTVYFIRWQDNWFREHAEEEFRLRRMELDIDRASWVVEMVMEWQDEKGQRLPAELIDKLSNNLFDTHLKRRSTSHPAEDLASALLEASSGFSLNSPQIGEIKMDRRSMKEFKRKHEQVAPPVEGE